MIKKLKKELLSKPESIINILESYDFSKPTIRGDEIRFGFGEGHNLTAIRLKLSESLWVSDYVRDVSGDIFEYISLTRDTTFVEVLKVVKAELGITEFSRINKTKVFGGFYDNIGKTSIDIDVTTYPESLLDNYDKVPTRKFLNDNIDFDSHKAFGIGYDAVSQRITIPIRNAFGELIGVKGRANWDVSEDEPKYLYLVRCPMSSTLYGYCQNYEYLSKGDILIFEAEKSVMQCYSYGIRNAVALGGNSLSDVQCKLLLERNPKSIVFMLDVGLDYEVIEKNAKKILSYARMKDVRIKYWDTSMTLLPDKSSPSDYGVDTLNKILNTELEEYIDGT
jgi:hypothetical protein